MNFLYKGTKLKGKLCFAYATFSTQADKYNMNFLKGKYVRFRDN